MKQRTMILTLVVSFLLFGAATVLAATTCTFTTIGTTMRLNADCTTDATISIPDGYTLDGQGHTITAMDPSGGHFKGAVVANAGTTAYVKNLTIDTASLANACDSGADRLRGIMFDGASGSIKHNTVLNINQGNSGCQEGNGIEVRNAPFDGTHPNTQAVTIWENVVRDYQKTGIVANGDVDVSVKFNHVTGFGPVNFIAQNGIQLGFGALGKVGFNTSSGNVFTPQTFASSGVLIFAAGDGIRITLNRVDASDVGIWLIAIDSAKAWFNKATNSTFDGIALDDQAGPVTNNDVAYNYTKGNDTGIGLYGAMDNLVRKNHATGNVSAGFFVGYGATSNTLSHNLARRNDGDGILVEADSNIVKKNLSLKNDDIGIAIDGANNTIRRNIAKRNGTSDIQNTGSNTYTGNICDHSSGSPVDCGASPFFLHGEVDAPAAAQPFN